MRPMFSFAKTKSAIDGLLFDNKMRLKPLYAEGILIMAQDIRIRMLLQQTLIWTERMSVGKL
jgi:hypothetical protein